MNPRLRIYWNNHNVNQEVLTKIKIERSARFSKLLNLFLTDIFFVYFVRGKKGKIRMKDTYIQEKRKMPSHLNSDGIEFEISLANNVFALERVWPSFLDITGIIVEL